MNKNSPEAGLHELVKRSLAGEVGTLDTAVLGRLRHARIRAVDAVGREPSWLEQALAKLSVQSLRRVPLAQAAAAMLVVVFSVSFVLTPQQSAEQTAVSSTEIQQNGTRALSEMDVLMSNEEIEFLDNLEVYEWLVAEYG